MIRQYEAVYVFDSTLEDAAINDKLGRLHGLLGDPGDLQLNHWGRRQLAYPIGRRESGYYVIARFGASNLPTGTYTGFKLPSVKPFTSSNRPSLKMKKIALHTPSCSGL